MTFTLRSGASGRALRLRSAVAAAAAVAFLVLPACGDADVKSGAAVIVDDQRTSIATLQDKVAAIAAERARTGQDAVPPAEQNRIQIQRIIVHRILERTAVAQGVTVTPSEVDARIAALEQQFGSKEFATQVAGANIAPDDLHTFIADDLLGQKIGEALVPGAQTDAELQQRQNQLNEVLINTAHEVDVAINPRYGTFDPSSGQVSPPTNPLVQSESPAAEQPTQSGQ